MALILGLSAASVSWLVYAAERQPRALRELSIVLFLAVIGLKSGGDFVDTLTQGEEVSWIGYGIFITRIPLITVGFAGAVFAKMNYLTLCGMLASSMTGYRQRWHLPTIFMPPAARRRRSYATVYPLVMFRRIIRHNCWR